MKISMIVAVGALAASAVAAVPADAQRHDDRGYDRGDYGDRYDRGDRYEGGRDDGRGYEQRRYGYGHGYRAGGYGYRDRGYGYGYRGGYRGDYRRGHGHSRVVCRIERGYYGPVRTCFRR